MPGRRNALLTMGDLGSSGKTHQQIATLIKADIDAGKDMLRKLKKEPEPHGQPVIDLLGDARLQGVLGALDYEQRAIRRTRAVAYFAPHPFFGDTKKGLEYFLRHIVVGVRHGEPDKPDLIWAGELDVPATTARKRVDLDLRVFLEFLPSLLADDDVDLMSNAMVKLLGLANLKELKPKEKDDQPDSFLDLLFKAADDDAARATLQAKLPRITMLFDKPTVAEEKCAFCGESHKQLAELKASNAPDKHFFKVVLGLISVAINELAKRDMAKGLANNLEKARSFFLTHGSTWATHGDTMANGMQVVGGAAKMMAAAGKLLSALGKAGGAIGGITGPFALYFGTHELYDALYKDEFGMAVLQTIGVVASTVSVTIAVTWLLGKAGLAVAATLIGAAWIPVVGWIAAGVGVVVAIGSGIYYLFADTPAIDAAEALGYYEASRSVIIPQFELRRCKVGEGFGWELWIWWPTAHASIYAYIRERDYGGDDYVYSGNEYKHGPLSVDNRYLAIMPETSARDLNWTGTESANAELDVYMQVTENADMSALRLLPSNTVLLSGGKVIASFEHDPRRIEWSKAKWKDRPEQYYCMVHCAQSGTLYARCYEVDSKLPDPYLRFSGRGINAGQAGVAASKRKKKLVSESGYNDRTLQVESGLLPLWGHGFVIDEPDLETGQIGEDHTLLGEAESGNIVEFAVSVADNVAMSNYWYDDDSYWELEMDMSSKVIKRADQTARTALILRKPKSGSASFELVVSWKRANCKLYVGFRADETIGSAPLNLHRDLTDGGVVEVIPIKIRRFQWVMPAKLMTALEKGMKAYVKKAGALELFACCSETPWVSYANVTDYKNTSDWEIKIDATGKIVQAERE